MIRVRQVESGKWKQKMENWESKIHYGQNRWHKTVCVNLGAKPAITVLLSVFHFQFSWFSVNIFVLASSESWGMKSHLPDQKYTASTNLPENSLWQWFLAIPHHTVDEFPNIGKETLCNSVALIATVYVLVAALCCMRKLPTKTTLTALLTFLHAHCFSPSDKAICHWYLWYTLIIWDWYMRYTPGHMRLMHEIHSRPYETDAWDTL